MHFFTFLLIVCCFGTLIWAAHHWSYQNPAWGGICDAGNKQSPINLNSYQSDRVSYTRLKLKNYRRVQTNLKLVNNGHTVKIDGFNPTLTLKGGHLHGEYVLEQFHMHWDSEHTFGGTRYPMEFHFVHRNTKYPDVGTATQHKDGVVVIGALYHLSYRDNYDLAYIVRHLRAVKSHSNINKPVRLAGPLVLDNLVPSLSSYYAYAGSLTTPSCAESVMWILPTRTYPVSRRQLDQFKQIEYKEGMQLRNNFRPLQRRGNRKVYLVSVSSGQAGLSESLSLILIYVLVNQKFLLQQIVFL